MKSMNLMFNFLFWVVKVTCSALLMHVNEHRQISLQVIVKICTTYLIKIQTTSNKI